LAAELAAQFPDAEITMIPSSGGRFEVLKDGVPVYEKSSLGRHAAKGEIVALLRSSA
jgi:predicted Rdx family selenoprotein